MHADDLTYAAGIMRGVLLALQNATNFTYTLHESVDGEYGAMIEANKYSGLIGMLQRNVSIDQLFKIVQSVTNIDRQSDRYVLVVR